MVKSKEKTYEINSNTFTTWIAIGLVLGLTVFNNIAIGIALGTALGVTMSKTKPTKVTKSQYIAILVGLVLLVIIGLILFLLNT